MLWICWQIWRSRYVRLDDIDRAEQHIGFLVAVLQGAEATARGHRQLSGQRRRHTLMSLIFTEEKHPVDQIRD